MSVLSEIHPYRDISVPGLTAMEVAIKQLESEGKKCIKLPDDLEVGYKTGTQIGDLAQYIDEVKSKGEIVDIGNVIFYSEEMGVLYGVEDSVWYQVLNNLSRFKDKSPTSLSGVWKSERHGNKYGGESQLWLDPDMRVRRIIIENGEGYYIKNEGSRV